MRTSSTATARHYDASVRRAKSAAAQRRVLDAAREILLAKGYRAASIKEIAARAGVSQEMIYKAFGSKMEIVKRLYDVTIAGDDLDLPIGERDQIRAAVSAPTGREAMELYGDFVATYQARAGQLQRLLAQVHPDVAEVQATTERERLAGITAFITALSDRKLTRPDLALSAAAETCWALTSPHVYQQLVVTRGWTNAAYQAWITTMLATNLL
jgi:AcrR family transcriptional regulator